MPTLEEDKPHPLGETQVTLGRGEAEVGASEGLAEAGGVLLAVGEPVGDGIGLKEADMLPHPG